MNQDRARLLWSQFLSERPLSKEDERELLQALQADDGLRADLMGEAEADGLLRALAARDDAETDASVRAFLEYLNAQRDESRFIRDVQLRRARDGRRRPAHARWTLSRGAVWRLAAAAVLLVAGGSILATLRKARPDVVVPDEKTAAPRVTEEEAQREEVRRRRAEEQQASAQRERKEAEERLAEVERRRQEALAAERRAAEQGHEEQRRRAEAEIARIEAERKAAEDRVRKAKDEELKTRDELARPPERHETRAEVARLERAEGEVSVISAGGERPARAGEGLQAEEGLKTLGAGSSAAVVYPDGTRLGLGEATLVREFSGRDVRAGKRVRVEQGILTARVARQRAESPMVFATLHGEARVLGTTLRLVVEPGEKGSTRVEVKEGKVRLTRSKDRKSVEVASGQYAVAAAGTELLARPIEKIANLVANPGFEIGRSAPLHWNLQMFQENTPTWDGLGHSGARSVKIRVAGTADANSGFAKSDLIKLEAGRSYVFSAWGKTENAGGGCLPAVRVRELDAAEKDIRQVILEFPKGTSDWTERKTEFQASPDAACAYVCANIWRGYGTFWVDDVWLSRKP